MLGILGKKVGMTHIYDENNRLVPCTVIEAGPCHVVQVKCKSTDGYEAIQLAFGEKKDKHTNKPAAGHYKKAGVKSGKYMHEIRVVGAENYKPGQKIDTAIFAKGDYVDVTGTSIGRGFQGGVRRWGWKGGDAGHGSMFHRAVGSIQSGARLNRVTKGHHLPGHMGADRVTMQNLEVLDVIIDQNLLVVKGSVPGHINCYLMVREARKMPKGFVKRKAAPIVSTKKSAKAHVSAAAKGKK